MQNSGIEAMVMDSDIPLAAAINLYVREGKDFLNLFFASVANSREGSCRAGNHLLLHNRGLSPMRRAVAFACVRPVLLYRFGRMRKLEK